MAQVPEVKKPYATNKMKIQPFNFPIKICTGAMIAGLFLGAAFTSLAQVNQPLHETRANALRDNYTGTLGCVFRVGSSNVVVSHLGIYNAGGAGLTITHSAGVFNSSGSSLLGSVTAASATVYYFTNDYQWLPLNPPLLLSANTTYLIASDVVSGSGDSWNDATAQTNWNTYFVGTNVASTRQTRYSALGAIWPTPPLSGFGSGNTYGNVSLAYIEVGQARAGVQSTNIAVAVGQPISIVGFASGATTINYQWYKGATLQAGKTNPTLSIASAALGDSGTYYLTATNGLGGSQSAAVTVSVTAFPVGISQQPTNLTAMANFYNAAAFSVTVTGTPPISLQWNRNGTPIPGATSSTYAFTPTSANNGDVFTCFASNNISGTPHTVTSANATLTVTPNLAQGPVNYLHGTPPSNITTNNFTGMVGGVFQTGNNSPVVTHLGYFASQFTDSFKTNATLTSPHNVGLFSPDGTTLYASVLVPSGVNVVSNGYMWVALNAPIALSPNTSYLIAAEVFSGQDPWGNAYVVPDWNSYYTGTNDNSTRFVRYSGDPWPTAPLFSFGSSGQTYSAGNLALLPLGVPTVAVSPLTATQYVGFSVTMNAVVNGQAPVTAQWYKAPATPLSGQTNLTLTLTNLTLGNSGDYYLIASNTLGTAQSSNVAVTVIAAVGPSITQNIASQTVYPHTTVHFTVAATGTPTLSYQWSFNSTPIAGATNTTLTVNDASSAVTGNYRVTITNPYGSSNSAIASLALIPVTWGSYPSAVMSADLLAYYRFSDVGSGFGVATNQGSLGFGYDGTYQGGYSPVSGPTGMSNFEPGNQAVTLDGLTSDVSVPPLGATVTSVTIAAWVNSPGGQVDNSTIFYHRAASVFGLSVFGDTNTLKYTWGGSYFWFDTGLVLPTNQWALAAMTISPSSAVIYLQDGTGLKSATNTASHGAATFSGASYVGWDSAGGALGRRWTGGVDEVMIFNRALTGVEVNALYLGVPGSATLTITPSGGNVTLTWPGGKLLEANSVSGPWTTNVATSPLTVPATGAEKFYRVQLQP